MKDKQIIVRVSEKMKSDFEKYCIKNGYSPSKRMRVLIQNDITNSQNTVNNGCSL